MRARTGLAGVKDTLQRLVHACGYHISRLPAPVASFEPARSPEPRVCHYEHLFVSHSGDLFPCCDTWNQPALRIGHLDEPDLMEKIRRFKVPCTLCGAYTLRAGKQDEPARVTDINIETSLTCQAQCAMCCVEAPDWRGNYEYYDALMRLVGQLRPASLLVQGGEVLIQRRTLAMLDDIKCRWPAIRIGLVTNGSADTGMVDTVERLFSSVTVSIVGFQPGTYRSIMGLPFDRMAGFVDELSKRKGIELTLKFLLTPSNLHEAPLFLEWAIGKQPAKVVVDDAGMGDYVNRGAPYQYWPKMVARTLRETKAVLTKNYSQLAATGVKVYFTTSARRTLAWSGDWDQLAGDERLKNVIARWV
jgi:pyruvate-formate lyase-activating enzyme